MEIDFRESINLMGDGFASIFNLQGSEAPAVLRIEGLDIYLLSVHGMTGKHSAVTKRIPKVRRKIIAFQRYILLLK